MLARPQLFSLALIALATPAAFGAQEELKIVNKEVIASVLKERNLAFTTGLDSNRNDYFEFKLGTHQVFMHFLSNQVLWMYADFDAAASLERLNDWNLNRLKSRAVRSKNQKTRLEWDLDIGLGLSRKSLAFFLQDFEANLKQFEVFLQNQAPASIQENFPVDLQNDDHILEVRFPTGDANWQTAWKIVWATETVRQAQAQGKVALKKRDNTEIDKNLFFKIKAAYLKPGRNAPWIQVLEDAFISEYYVPYHDGKTQWFDLRDHGFMETLQEKEKGPRGKVLGKDRVVIGEIRDRGLVYKHRDISRRGEELVLWVNFYARNYTYLVEFAFADDGTIAFRHAPTAFNFQDRKGDKENLVYPHLSHMHNALWRVGLKLGPEGNNTNNEVVIFRHKELKQAEKIVWPIHSGNGQFQQMVASAIYEEEAVRLEGGIDWNPFSFTRIRITNPDHHSVRDEQGKKIRNRYPIGYDAVALPAGITRPQPVYTAGYAQQERLDAAAFCKHDFWITRADSPVYEYTKLPEYFRTKGPRALQNSNVVLWHQSSVLHVPRAEDGVPQVAGGALTGQALASWSVFELRPRNVFTATPNYR